MEARDVPINEADPEATGEEAVDEVEEEEKAENEETDDEAKTYSEEEFAELQNRLLRSQAELDNFRKRVKRSRKNQKRAIEKEILGDLLPILDNFGRALTAAQKQPEDFDSMFQGMKMIRDSLEDFMESHGLEPYGSVGEKFDPRFHEAVLSEPTDKVSPNTVLQVLERGYKKGDTILRTAKVKVSRASAQATPD